MKKKLLAALSVAMVAVVVITGTMAYLTDVDKASNVMILSDSVDITLDEALVEKTEDSYVAKDERVKENTYEGVYPGAMLPKDPTIHAASDSADAYVRAIIRVTNGLNWLSLYGDVAPGSLNNFHALTANSLGEGWEVAFGGYEYTETGFDVMYVATYTKALKAGESTTPVFEKIYFSKEITNEHIEGSGNRFSNQQFNIDVTAEAIQAAGFSNPYSAFAAEDGVEKEVYDADGLVEALEKNENVLLMNNVKINPASMSNAYGTTGINVKNGQTIDGNGHTLDIKGAGGTWDSGINTTGGTIKNLTVTGSFRGIFINHNSTYSETVVLENVTIDGTVYTISCDQGMNQDLEAYNSTFNGWTSYAATLGKATFVDCNFGEGSGYAYMRPYAPTTFVNCAFEAGYEMDLRAACTFENCTIGGVALTTNNIGTLVTGNLQNATVK